MFTKCSYCNKIEEWAKGKIEVKLNTYICNQCLQKMLLVQLSNIAVFIRDFKNNFQINTDLSKKASKLIDKIDNTLNEGDEWKEK